MMINGVQSSGLNGLSQSNASTSPSSPTERLQFVQQMMQQMMNMMQELIKAMQDDINKSAPGNQQGGGAPGAGGGVPGAAGGAPAAGGGAPGAGGGAPAAGGGAPAADAGGAPGAAPAAGVPAGGNTVNGVDMTPGANGDISPKQVADAYKNEIDAASKATGIPPGILAGQIWQESRGKPNTPGGGLMQIQGEEFKSMGGGDINNAGDNIMAGAKYMQQMQEKYPDIPLALRAYNSGPNGVDPNNANATPAGTGDPTYVDKVLKAAEESGLRTS